MVLVGTNKLEENNANVRVFRYLDGSEETKRRE